MKKLLAVIMMVTVVVDSTMQYAHGALTET